MKRFLLAAVAAFALAAPLAANAATVNFAIVFSEAPSTSVACTAVTGLTVPVAAGTNVASCAVSPAGWTGSLALSGTGAASFVVGSGVLSNGLLTFPINVGSSAYTTAGTVNLTATSTP